jgi:glutathione-independent formaldehyde dehydrogenase
VSSAGESRRHPGQEDPRQVIDDLARLINPTGRLAVIGVFTSADAAPSPHDGFDRRVDGVVKVVFTH